MIEIDANTKVTRTALPGSRIDDEMVFFNQDSGKYYGTGPVGAEIWDFLDAPKSIKEICNHLLEKFEVDQSTCEKQVKNFVSDLFNSGIVKISS